MGYGDEILGLGFAQAAPKDKKVALGNGRRILWTRQAHEVFYGQSDVLVWPGHETSNRNLFHWIHHYVGHRLYHAAFENRRFIFNRDFRPPPPPKLIFTPAQEFFSWNMPDNMVVIEPNVKPGAENKQWPRTRYQQVSDALAKEGYNIVQFVYAGGFRLKGAQHIVAPDFMSVASALRKAALYIGPEGGLHHAAASVGTGAVVIFGGYIHPRTTGYGAIHTNLGYGDDGCGNRTPCGHCGIAMSAITTEQVLDAARTRLVVSGRREASAALDALGERREERAPSIPVCEVSRLPDLDGATPQGD